ncbi:TSUP family transporter [Larkinella insperata]|uniref:Probable membrane transporter protein n=1 Tax=Larkinella insperata TaxID=332158 RepID=A0ABW3QJQ4_9BACT
MSDIKISNANKTLFVGIANAVAVLLFILADKVLWLPTGIMLTATSAGGYWGALYTKRVDPEKLRTGIIAFNFLITAAFFIRIYLNQAQ